MALIAAVNVLYYLLDFSPHRAFLALLSDVTLSRALVYRTLQFEKNVLDMPESRKRTHIGACAAALRNRLVPGTDGALREAPCW